MNAFLLSCAVVIILAVALGLARVFRGPGEIDALMATQLLGSGGIGALLLVSNATEVPGVADVALGLALLAAFATISFVNALETDGAEAGE